MHKKDEEQSFNVRSLLLWQIMVVIAVALLFSALALPWLSVLFGGFVVVVSTWHVYQSISVSGGDKLILLKSAGIRFALFLMVVAAGVFFLALQPLYLIVGMAIAYVTMYVKSLIMIFEKMKGEDVG
ncbi:MAG TPA: hypothetical protein EYP39_04370 [Ghiorsea sp.]|nr:hypothetical protein [Ghiorsea sp.]HIP06881.1 hypothetical protein [Mariprofundaceae bacterium]